MSIYSFRLDIEFKSKLVMVMGALAGWSAVIFNWQPFFKVNSDSDPENLPVRTWLPILTIAILVVIGLIVWAFHFY